MKAGEFEALLGSLQKDKGSFEKLYNYYYTKIVMHVKARYGKMDFAADVAQEFFIRLLRKPPQEVTNPTAYVMKAADNIAYDNYKKQKSTTDLEDYIMLCGAENYTEQGEIKEILSRLPQQEREIVVMRIYGGYKFDEISQEKGINASTVRSLYRRALKKCEQFYKDKQK